MNRLKAWLILLGAGTLLIRAAESDLQVPPAHPPADMPHLSNLLLDSLGAPITSKRGWLKQRACLKRQWQDFLGAFPKEKVPLQAQVKSSEKLADFTRQFVTYQIEEGLFTDGYLLTPNRMKGKLPAVVVFHPTTPVQARGVAGLEREYPDDKWQGLQLVQRGFVVWCPRNYINTEGADWAGNAARVLTRHTNWTGMTRMIWDAIRAADFLESLPQVDRKRIGCLGHSLGAKEVLYAMAFDERYHAGVSSEGGIGLRFSNWDAPWYLGRRISAPDFRLEHHQLLGLIAPRAFLLLAGDSADGDRSWAFIQAVRPVYQLRGASNNIGWFNHHRGHNYPPEARAAAEMFLDHHLKPRSAFPQLPSEPPSVKV